MESGSYGHQWAKKKLAVLTSDLVATDFNKKMYGRFARQPKKWWL